MKNKCTCKSKIKDFVGKIVHADYCPKNIPLTSSVPLPIINKPAKEPNVNKKSKNDVINSPKHYTLGNIEPIEAIEDWELNFNIGQVVKYVARAGKKDGSSYEQDLKK